MGWRFSVLTQTLFVVPDARTLGKKTMATVGGYRAFVMAMDRVERRFGNLPRHWTPRASPMPSSAATPWPSGWLGLIRRPRARPRTWICSSSEAIWSMSRAFYVIWVCCAKIYGARFCSSIPKSQVAAPASISYGRMRRCDHLIRIPRRRLMKPYAARKVFSSLIFPRSCA